MGDSAVDGVQGATGQKGLTGAKGVSGFKGENGSEGTKGMRGSPGPLTVPVSVKCYLFYTCWGNAEACSLCSNLLQCACSSSDLPSNSTAGAMRIVAREKSLYVYTRQLGWVKVTNQGRASRRRRDTNDQPGWEQFSVTKNESSNLNRRKPTNSKNRSNQLLAE